MTKAEELHIDKTIKAVGKAVNRYDMIKDSDTVAVALSGGKDSHVLLETLVLRKKHLPIDYTLHAVHVNITNIPYEVDREHLESFCRCLGVPFHYRELEIEQTEKEALSPCFLCSWHRRKELFRFCEEHRCGKLALGHHRDDIIETFILNMMYQGSLSTMPPRLAVFGGNLEIIRPLALLAEDKIAEYARIRAFPPQKKECRHGGDSRREAVRKIIDDMEQLHGEARSTIFKAMTNIHGDYLP